MASETRRKTFYLCDHTKADACPKTICFFLGVGTSDCTCFCTTKVEQALLNDRGDPVVFDSAEVIGK